MQTNTNFCTEDEKCFVVVSNCVRNCTFLRLNIRKRENHYHLVLTFQTFASRSFNQVLIKMSDAAPAKKKAAPKKPAEHPKYSEMIAAAIVALKERTGSSRIAILKYIKANYKVGDNAATCVKNALKKGVVAGALTQVKGVGSNGSFKVVKKTEPKKAKKPKTPKKKPAAKKTPKKAAKKSSQKTSCKEASCKEDTQEGSQEACSKETSSQEASSQEDPKEGSQEACSQETSSQEASSQESQEINLQLVKLQLSFFLKKRGASSLQAVFTATKMLKELRIIFLKSQNNK